MIGLYYPYIHFRDENWLKLALMYWSKIARIVPESYTTHDSDDVQMVNDELGAIINSPPYSAGSEVADDFMAFVLANAKQLRKKYDITRSAKWPVVRDTAVHAPTRTDPRFAYVYHEKLGDSLAGVLTSERLAVWGEGRGASRDMRWIGVHPKIASVYMTSMAESIADSTGYKLLADDLVQQVAVGERSVNRLAEILLHDQFAGSQQSLISYDAIAVVALRTVLPRDLAKVPIEKIIELRQKYPNELADFQTWVHAEAKQLADRTGGVSSPEAMNEYLTVLEEQTIEPKLKNLKKILSDLSLESATTAVAVKLPVIIAIEAAAHYLHQPSLGVAGAAVSLIPIATKGAREAQKFATGNFAAYLLHAQEKLTPQSLLKRLGTKARKFLIDI